MEKKKNNNQFRALGNLGVFVGRAKGAPKLEPILEKTLEEIVIFKNQRELRCVHGSGNVANLLQNGHYELASHRADYILREQNMFEVFAIMERYCKLLMERAETLKQQRGVCPQFLKEAISSLMFCSSRFGDLHELRQLRTFFEEKFGSEFASSALQLQSGHRLNLDIMERLSEKEPTLDGKIQMLKDIALKKGITVNLDALERILQEKSPEISPQEQEQEDEDEEDEDEGDEEKHQPMPPTMSSSTNSNLLYNLDQDRSSNYETGHDHDKAFEKKNEANSFGYVMKDDDESIEKRSLNVERLRKQKTISLSWLSEDNVQRNKSHLHSSRSAIVHGSCSKDKSDDESEVWYVRNNSRLLSLREKRLQRLHVQDDHTMEEENIY